eukprot:3646043-Pyramimonas_sp.AAC.1
MQQSGHEHFTAHNQHQWATGATSSTESSCAAPAAACVQDEDDDWVDILLYQTKSGKRVTSLSPSTGISAVSPSADVHAATTVEATTEHQQGKHTLPPLPDSSWSYRSIVASRFARNDDRGTQAAAAAADAANNH